MLREDRISEAGRQTVTENRAPKENPVDKAAVFAYSIRRMK